MMRKFTARCTVPVTLLLALAVRRGCEAEEEASHGQARHGGDRRDGRCDAASRAPRPRLFPRRSPAQHEENGAPKTRAAAVLVTDVRSGQILYEKNADAPRAAASTQKLLTALIVAEAGYLDQPVTVEQIDTFAEPVRLNIRPGEVYPADRSAARAPGEKP